MGMSGNYCERTHLAKETKMKKHKGLAVATLILMIVAITAGTAFADLDTEGLVAHWSFDNPADPGHDDSANGHNGILYGPVWESAALRFDGSDDYVDVTDDGALSGMANLSVACRFKADYWPAWEIDDGAAGLVCKASTGDGSDSSDSYKVSIYTYDNKHRISVGLYSPSEAGLNVAIEDVVGSIDASAWHYLGLTYDGSIARLYWDGTEIATEAISGTLNSTPSVPLRIGHVYGASAHNLYFNGLIDEVRIYDRALSADEVQQLYGEDTYWQVDTGNWSTPGNWSEGEPEKHVQAYINNGGTAEITLLRETCEHLRLGESSTDNGNVLLSLGRLVTNHEIIGFEGTGTFTQTGGAHESDRIILASEPDSTGTYELESGFLSTMREHIGAAGTGLFRQTGGINVMSLNLYLGQLPGSSGSYELSGTGQLSAQSEIIGSEGSGIFTQTGGENTVDLLRLATKAETGNGTYTISGGSLIAGCVYIGFRDGTGTLNITGSAAEIAISDFLSFGKHSAFTAVPGATIHMTGSNLKIVGTNPNDLAGLSNLQLIFEGGTEDIDLFEVAGEDMGAVIEGLDNNFALGTLTLGGADIGQIQLVDMPDNQPDWEGSEALYVENLNIGAGSYLDLNGYNLYYRSGMIDPTATIDYNGGNLILVIPIEVWGQAYDPSPADGSNAGPEYYPPNVYMMLDYTPGDGAITHTAYFSDVEQDVIDRNPAKSLGSTPPWPAVSETAFVVGYDDVSIVEYARTPLVAGTTYYWCIDEFDGVDTWSGNVWRFTVMPEHAWGPTPEDGAEMVPADLTLTWNLGDLETSGYSVRYILYIGTDEAAIEAIAAGSTTAPEYVGAPIEPTSFDITDLDPETEHFWRVDTRRMESLPPFPTVYEKGEVWSFTTGP